MGLDTLRLDLVLAWRSLRSSPGHALLVIGTLALGIAGATTVVSVMNPYLIRDVPYREPDRLVQLGHVDPVSGWDAARFSLPQAEDLRARSRSLAALASYYYTSKNLTGVGEAEGVVVGVLSSDLLELLGVEAKLGRAIIAADGGPLGRDVVLLSDGLWRRRYGADPGVLGRGIELDGAPYTVIGVMGPEFQFPFGGVKLWIPLRGDAATESRDAHRHILVGLLRPPSDLDSARRELTELQKDLGHLYPEADGRYTGITVKPLGEALNFGYDVMRSTFVLVLGAVVFLLLIACVNVASLTLVRLGARARDVAVRSALGAGRQRILRQLLAENLLLALVGGALGVALAVLAARAIAPIIPEDLYRVGEVEIDATVLLFSTVLTLATPLLFGLAPALSATRLDLSSALKTEARTSGAGSMWARRGLVVLEVALAIVLVTGTGLMFRSVMALQHEDLGFARKGLLTAEVTLPADAYANDAEQAAFFDRALEEMGALARVRVAAAVRPLPMNHETSMVQFSVAGRAPAATKDWPVAQEFLVSPRYFEAMGIPLLSGRSFDVTESSPSVVVNEAMVEQNWPGRDPVGETLRLLVDDEMLGATVVGVAASVKHDGFDDDLASQVYRPLSQAEARRRFLVLAIEGEPLGVVGAVRNVLRDLDPAVPAVYRPMADIVAENALPWSIASLFLGAFGVVALALAALGVYGVVSYSVAARKKEMATRMALGATADDVRRAVLGEGLKLVAFGLGMGLALAVVLANLVASFLYGVRPFDPVTLGTVVVVFLMTATLASLVPALRASRTHPWQVLRSE